jgi:hypothetical protein
MSGGAVGSTTVAQIGIVVRDVARTAKEFAEAFGIPVPEAKWTAGSEAAQTQYRGAPTAARAKLAFMRFGSLDIELIEPDTEPSTWREFLDTRGEGVHHIAFVIEGMKGRVVELGAKGFSLVQKGEYTGGRYAYIDTTRALKTIVELLENDPGHGTP